jgi:hypothetical protein
MTAEPAGPAVQGTPGELPAQRTTPILPPLTPPQQPSWKQELKPAEPGGEKKE